MSDALEDGYRRVLMMLPRAYWAEHAEEMLAVLMDGAEPGQTRPRARDVLSVAGLAMRLRFAVKGARDSGRVAGDIARRAVLAYMVLDFGLLVQWNAYGARIGYSFLPMLLQAGIIAALIRGWSWCGRVLCFVYGGLVIHVQWQYWGLGSLWWYGELEMVLPLLVLAVAAVAFHRRAPRIAGPNWWFLALTAITVAFWIRGKTVDHMPASDISHTPALSALIYAAAAIVALWRARSSPVWPAALALAGFPMMAERVVAYLNTSYPMALADSPRDQFYVVLAIGCECVLVAAGLASLLYRLYQRRSLMKERETA